MFEFIKFCFTKRLESPKKEFYHDFPALSPPNKIPDSRRSLTSSSGPGSKSRSKLDRPTQQQSVFLEKFKTWPLHTRIYYNYMKRPAVAIGTPFYNWGRDYYAVGEDHVNDFKKQPIRSELNRAL